MKVLAIGMITYGFLKGAIYRGSKSLTGKRLGMAISLFYISIGVAMLFVHR